MSRFIEAARMATTGARRAVLEPLSVTIKNIPDQTQYTATDEYEFRAEWVARGYCLRGDMKLLERNFFRELQHAIYGDFFERLVRLERAFLAHDREAISMELRDLFVEITGE